MFYQPVRPCQSMVGMLQNIFNTQGEHFGSRKWIEQETGERWAWGWGDSLDVWITEGLFVLPPPPASGTDTFLFCFMCLCVWYGVFYSCLWPGFDRKLKQKNQKDLTERTRLCDNAWFVHGPLVRALVFMLWLGEQTWVGSRILSVWNHNFTFEILESCSSSPWHGL